MESQNHDEDEGSEVDDDGMAVDQEEDENERIRDFLRSENVDPFEKSDRILITKQMNLVWNLGFET